MVFYGKIMTISIAWCMENQRYVFLCHIVANCDLVLFPCDILVWMLYMFNNLGVKPFANCFHCDLLCNIDFWMNLAQQLSANYFATKSHLVDEVLERMTSALVLVSLKK